MNVLIENQQRRVIAHKQRKINRMHTKNEKTTTITNAITATITIATRKGIPQSRKRGEKMTKHSHESK